MCQTLVQVRCQGCKALKSYRTRYRCYNSVEETHLECGDIINKDRWRTPRSCRNCRGRKDGLSNRRKNQGLRRKLASPKGPSVDHNQLSLNMSSIEEWPHLTQQPDTSTSATTLPDALPGAISSSESVDSKPLNAAYHRYLRPSRSITPPPLPSKPLRFSGLYLPDGIWAPTIPNQQIWQINHQTAFLDNKLRRVWRNSRTNLPLSCDILPKGDELDGHHDRITQMVADLVFESDDTISKPDKEFQNGFAMQETARSRPKRLCGAANEFRPGCQYHQRAS
jgi:hypothetical protein